MKELFKYYVELKSPNLIRNLRLTEIKGSLQKALSAYRRQRFENFFEISLCNCFGQLATSYLLKICWTLTEHEVDSACGFCMY